MIGAENMHLESMYNVGFGCRYDATQGNRGLLLAFVPVNSKVDPLLLREQLEESWIVMSPPVTAFYINLIYPFVKAAKKDISIRSKTLEAVRTTWGEAEYNGLYKLYSTIASDQLVRRVGT